ncbi:hypothetical protein AVEN_55341-1 [Araneus ventricosus]|uniref:Uncharacterized protein n=1 Tax=Araneus ventricosus TaxID=182803 RepID=A0A4Y2DE84_ARAVE|nr:hypothetical protein AVEN_55341-1 [Araneus ventricosus]
MNYTLMPSLEHIALVKVATTLWNQDDIRALIEKFYSEIVSGRRIREKWQVIEDKVVEKLPQLSQPEPLKSEILGFIKPIGSQILKWLEYHIKNCQLHMKLPNLCWTPEGTVDKKKTAEVLSKDENLDITRRYELACIYCLEDDIPELWNKIPKNHRIIYYKEDPIKVCQ